GRDDKISYTEELGVHRGLGQVTRRGTDARRWWARAPAGDIRFTGGQYPLLDHAFPEAGGPGGTRKFIRSLDNLAYRPLRLQYPSATPVALPHTPLSFRAGDIQPLDFQPASGSTGSGDGMVAKRPTINDGAREAGVSKGTVSAVLNGRDSV